MTSRQHILSALRSAAKAQSTTVPAHPTNPPTAPLDDDLVAHFTRCAEALSSVVIPVSDPARFAQQAAALILEAGYGLTGTCTLPPEQWASYQAAGFVLHAGPVVDADQVGITASTLAIAETGTVVLTDAEAYALTASLAPTVHIATVRLSTLVATWEQALARLGPDQVGRFHAISGPARTGDIEQTITLGAHGPRMVVIGLVDA